MALDSRRGYRSGKAFELGVHRWIRGGSIIEDGELVERDNGIDSFEVTRALNDAALSVIQAAVRGANRGGKDRLTIAHEFTYPASTECVVLQPSALTLPGAVVLEPALARPVLDVVALVDRSVSYAGPEVQPVPMERFDTTAGARWAFASDAIYFSDLYGVRGRSAARDLRLVYVPAPEPIDIANETPRTDIPRELHKSIELCAALEILESTGNTRAASLRSTYEAELAEALASFRPAINAARYVKSTRPIRR